MTLRERIDSIEEMEVHYPVSGRRYVYILKAEVMANIDAALAAAPAEGPLDRRATLRLVAEWLDMEEIADSLAASEGADSYSSHDTDDAARRLRSEVAARLAEGEKEGTE